MKRWSYVLFPLLVGAAQIAACSSDPAPADTTDSGAGEAGPLPPKPDGGPRPDATPELDAAPDAAPDAPVGPPAGCTVTKAGTKGVVLKGTVLLPESIEDGGEVFYDGATILCAAASCAQAAGYAAASQVTCDGVVISPGLINPHDHITFANNPPKGHGNERYEHRHDWRKGIRGHTKITVAGGASADVVRFAELRFVMSGATATAGAGGAPNLLRNLDNSTAQLEGLSAKIANSDTFPLKDSDPANTLPTACSGFSATRVTNASIANLDGYLPHISEGIDNPAHAEFTCQSVDGDTHDLIVRQTAVVHGIAVSPADVAKYRADQSVLIWSPRSNVDLYGDTAPVVLYDRLGVQIALGTDWVASGSMNLSRELRCADELNQKYYGKHFTDKALWKMVTMNAAFATGVHQVTGMLKAGYAADIALFNARTSKGYRAVIDAGVEDTLLVLRGGKPLYGNAAILDLDPIGGKACEPLDVCGVPKKACVAQDSANAATLARIKTAGEAFYPLFFCKGVKPTNEPSCTPFRASYPAGITAADKDGDGIADAQDNCPAVFNPVRPMDGTAQGDADGDGVGDACDKCPLTAGETCTPPSADDIDGDGVANGVDNCPEIANPLQDDCSRLYTVQSIRDPADPDHPAAGAQVRVQNVFVTAVRTAGSGNKGFFAQINSQAPFSGIYVDTGATVPTVVVGNEVKVSGKYAEVFGISTLTNPTITVTNPGTTLPFLPIVVTAAEAADPVGGEAYEGLLCQIDAPSVSNANPDAPSDFDEFEIDGALRVDDQLYDAMDNSYAVGATFPKIVGICAFSFSNRKVWPRSAIDLQ